MFAEIFPKSFNFSFIGAGAGKILGVRRIFVRILPNVPEKTPNKQSDLQKKLCMRFWAPFFSNQSRLGATFAHILSKSVQIFRDFAKKFHGFFPDFNQVKTFRGALALSATPPPTPVLSFHSAQCQSIEAGWVRVNRSDTTQRAVAEWSVICGRNETKHFVVDRELPEPSMTTVRTKNCTFDKMQPLRCYGQPAALLLAAKAKMNCKHLNDFKNSQLRWVVCCLETREWYKTLQKQTNGRPRQRRSFRACALCLRELDRLCGAAKPNETSQPRFSNSTAAQTAVSLQTKRYWSLELSANK